MNTSRSRLRLSILAAALAVGALLTGTAWTSSKAETRGFVCNSGDRFVVEFLTDHVRLRHGSGIFALAEVKPGRIWSDGQRVLQAGRSAAVLELPGTEQLHTCVATPA
ncbi:MAG: hypothetical protein LPJ91_04445 [Pseudazoarcus pumilus]|nr:hypothetical protein [Pseudazoarcus pumilus]